MRLIYFANIIVAGWIGVSCLVSPKYSSATIFSNAYPAGEVMRLVGALWLSIAVLSIAGLWKPITFSPVLLIQFIYKGVWLLVVALPAIRHQQSFPSGMALFFLLWVIALPFFIPWKELISM